MENKLVVNDEMIFSLIDHRFTIFKRMEAYIFDTYGIVGTWNKGGKRWDYEYKYVYKSKNFCYFYFKNNVLGFMLIFGKKEREVIEQMTTLSNSFMNAYQKATTYHDGKWVMLELEDLSYFDDIKQLLLVKHKPVM